MSRRFFFSGTKTLAHALASSLGSSNLLWMPPNSVVALRSTDICIGHLQARPAKGESPEHECAHRARSVRHDLRLVKNFRLRFLKVLCSSKHACATASCRPLEALGAATEATMIMRLRETSCNLAPMSVQTARVHYAIFRNRVPLASLHPGPGNGRVPSRGLHCWRALRGSEFVSSRSD